MGKTAWDECIGSFIKPCLIISDKHWFFQTCLSNGDSTSAPMKAKVKYKDIKWRNKFDNNGSSF